MRLLQQWLCHLILITVVVASVSSARATDKNTGLQKLTEAARQQRLTIDFNDGQFSGPGYDRLLEEGQRAHFFLIGEEHGIAENPLLVGQLFRDLTKYDYGRMAIEISPPMASLVDSALRQDGLESLRKLYARPGGEPAFFGMREEAEMLAAVRAAVPSDQPALWGCDYEVAGDRTLLRQLKALGVPAQAQAAFDVVNTASLELWQKWAETGNPQFIFSFSGDPQLIRNLRAAWPSPNAQVESILHTLEETLSINQLWTSGQGHASNVRRGALLRRNFLGHWQALPADQPRPRVMAKFGASHMVRGLNTTNTWDMGALIPELAAIEGLSSVSVLVLPGPDAMIARLDPTSWRYLPAPAKDGYARGIEPLIEAAHPERFTLIDLRPLRALATARSSGAAPNLIRTVTGFDYLLVMSGSTPAGEFEHP